MRAESVPRKILNFLADQLINARESFCVDDKMYDEAVLFLTQVFPEKKFPE